LGKLQSANRQHKKLVHIKLLKGIGDLESKSPRPLESRKSERISTVDPREDVCRVIIQIRKSSIGTHIREQFEFALDKVQGVIWTVHSSRTRVGKSEEIRVRRFVHPEDRKPLHFGIAKSEILMRRKSPLWGPGDVISS
jgi:hypothetical protein